MSYRAIYVGDEFPELNGKEVIVLDSADQSGFPCYSLVWDGEEIGNMDDGDFEFLDFDE